MTEERFRRMALSLPESVEGEHMGHPDFRVSGKIFATLWPSKGWGMVKLTVDQQAAFLSSDPVMFRPVPGGWGRRGATQVILAKATVSAVRQALAAAWRNTASKKLIERLDR